MHASPKKVTIPKTIRENSESRSEQFVNAVRWLEFMGDVKSYAHLAKLLGVSPASISGIMKGKAVSERIATRLEEKLLKRHKHTLAAFEKPYLLDLGNEAINKKELASLLSTKIVAIEAGINVLLNHIVTLNKKMGELQKAIKKNER